jgi:hypothetical protein
MTVRNKTFSLNFNKHKKKNYCFMPRVSHPQYFVTNKIHKQIENFSNYTLHSSSSLFTIPWTAPV